MQPIWPPAAEPARVPTTPETFGNPPIPQKSVFILDGMIQRRDPADMQKLSEALHPDNKGWRQQWEDRTGIKLPKGYTDTKRVIEGWLNRKGMDEAAVPPELRPQTSTPTNFYGGAKDILSGAITMGPATPTFKEGDRVTYTSNGKTVTGTVRGTPDDAGLVQVNVDQIARPGGVPIGRIEYPHVDSLKPHDDMTTVYEGGPRSPGSETIPPPKIPQESTSADVPNTEQRPGRTPPGTEPVLSGEAGPSGGESEPPARVPQQRPDAPAESPSVGGRSGGAGGAGNDEQGIEPGRSGGRRPAAGGKPGKRAEPRTEHDGKPVEPGPAPEGPRVHDLDERPAADVRDVDHNHRIAPEDTIAPPGQTGKIRGNVRALELLKKLEAEDRNATPEEKKVLAQYVGFGPIGEVVNRVKAEVWERHQTRLSQGSTWSTVPDDVKSWAEKYYDDFKKLRDMVTRSEFENITASTRNAHYTGKDIISRGIWPAVEQLGFTGGNVLETSAGIGHMIGLTPTSLLGTTKWTAVELDSLSARILKKLYPEANVLHSPFQEAPLKRNVFDLIVGNVPFAKDKIETDEGYPKFSLHNYFLAKSIDMLRPRGLMVAISSISSLDADASRQWREWMAERADLVGAIRLPNNAFIKNANTAVTTDILIFRKKDTIPFAHRTEFSYTIPLDTKETGKQGGVLEPIPLNVYYDQHPEMLLGKMSAKGEMYGGIAGDRAEPTMEPTPGDIGEKLDAAVAKLPKDIAGEKGDAQEVTTAPAGTRMYSVLSDEKGVYQITPEGKVKLEGQQATAAKHYVSMRDAMLDVVSRQIDDSAKDVDIERSRKELKRAYDAFTKEYGYVNRERPGTATQFLRDEPDWNKIAALETVEHKAIENGKTKTGKTKYKLRPVIRESDILSKRTQWPFKEPETAASMADAIAVSEFFRGSLELPYVAKLRGIGEDAARKQLLNEGLVYIDPETGRLVSRAAYLSGNVKEKLKLAEKASKDDATYTLNVDALKAIQPATKPISKIALRMGATWVPHKAYEDFAKELFGPGSIAARKTSTGQWTVAYGGPRGEDGVANAKKYGSPDFNGVEIFKHILEVDPLIAYDDSVTEAGNPSKKKNPERSAQAEAMAEVLRDKFLSWAKSGPHSADIADAYNANFNGSIPRKFEAPPYAHFPGAAQSIKLRDYQRAAAMRGVFGSYLNAHEVGMGKTFTGITTAMEWRRLRLATKPIVVVQPSTLNQFAGSFNRLYPNANILVPSEKDREGANRSRLINRIVSGDWDSIVMPHTLFNQIGVSPKYAEAFIQGEIDDLISAAAEAVEVGGRRSPTAKKLQEQIDSLREYLDKLKLKAKEGKSLFLDELGIDGMIVDEAHDYKNSYFRTAYTQLKGVNSNASERSLDMLLKTKYVQQKVGAGRNIVLMTGTPVSNTIGEAWVMMRYVRPDVLERNHITNFDDFCSAFADISAKEEMDATNRYKPQLRMRAFTNVPQFQSIWSDVVDVVRYDDLPESERSKINRPELRGGKPLMIDLEPVPDVLRIMRGLVARYEWFEGLRGKARYENRHVPGQINTLARKASIDPRMIEPGAADHPGSKVNRLVDEVHKRWVEGAEHKTAQIVFSDLYRDNPDNPTFNVLEDIKKKLVAKGIPESEVVVATDLNDASRAAVFQKVNDGDIRVIMGTTPKLGVGVNIQERLQALHHLDAPYRPMDMEQREGRIVRFGNLVPALTGEGVDIVRYGVKKTFDSGQYERLARKQRAVNDTLSGKATEDEVEGAGEEMMLNFSEAAAAFSGDPDVLRKVELDNEIRRLHAIRASFEDALEDTHRRISDERRRRASYAREKAASLEFKAAHGEAFGEHPAVSIGKGDAVSGKEAVKALDVFVKDGIAAAKEGLESSSSPRVRKLLGTITVGGIPFEAEAYAQADRETGIFDPSYAGVSVKYPDTMGGFHSGSYKSGSGLLEAIRSKARDIIERPEMLDQQTEQSTTTEGRLQKTLAGMTFENQGELDKAKAEHAEVMKRLTKKKEAEQVAGPPSDPNDPHGGSLTNPIRRGHTTLPADIIQAIAGTTIRAAQTTKRAAKSGWRMANLILPRASDAMKKLGPEGKALARETEEIAHESLKRGNTDTADMNKVLEGLSARDIEIVAKIGQKRVIPIGKPNEGLMYRVVYSKLAEVSDRALEIADRSMEGFAALGGKRTVDGEKVDIKGGGGWYPQVPNAEGRALLDEAKADGLGSARVAALADRMVREGQAKTPEGALAKLLDLRSERLRGVNPYLERSRMLLPEEYVDFDARHTLPPMLHRNALLVAAARRWGVSFEGAKARIAKIGAEYGGDAEGLLSEWVRAHFEGAMPGDSHALWGAIGNYETLARMGFSPLTVLRNLPQRWTNTVLYEPQVALRAMAKYPPIINRWIRSARAIEDHVHRAGASASTSELVSVESAAPGAKLTQTAMAPFQSVEQGNQTTAALMASIGLDRDMRDLIRTGGPGSSRLKAVLESLVSATGFRDPSSAKARRVGKVLDMDPSDVLERIKRGDPLTPAEIEEAMHRFTTDTQFGMNLATERLWWRSHPFFRLMAKFKPWALDQMGFIFDHVGKEAAKGNFGPLVRFVAGTIIAGELYNIVRDWITGSDESAVGAWKHGEAGKIPWRLAKDLVDGGGIGILADMAFGLFQTLGGPATNSAANVLEAAHSAALDPKQTGTALRKLFRSEVAATKPIEAATNWADNKLNPKNRWREVVQLRRRVADAHQEFQHPTAAGKIGTAALGTFRGIGPRFEQTPSTLKYEYAARQIDVGDVGDAADYLAAVLKEAKPADRKKAIDGIKQSMERHSPLGTLSKENGERGKWLASLPQAERERALNLYRGWMRDYSEAIRQAVKQSGWSQGN